MSYFGDKKIVRLLAMGHAYILGEEVAEAPGVTIVKITYSAGTSGVEYIVHLSNGNLLQFRGDIGYKATWVSDRDE